MPPIDECLIDPEPRQLVKLLDRAARRGNARLKERRVDKAADFWPRFVRRAAKSAAGHRVWRGGRGGMPAAFVKASWWTDPVGRRHWRVEGRRVWYGDPGLRRSAFTPYPVWHVYPARLYLRRGGPADELIALCSCGVSGPPASIAWTGNCCGPCHDRREMGEQAPPDGGECPPVLRRYPSLVSRLTFVDDGRLVCGGQDARLVLWDPNDGTSRVLLHRPRSVVYALTASADGTLAASTAMNRVIVLRPGQREWTTVPLRSCFVSCLALSPDGRWLAVGGSSTSWLLDLDADDGRPRELHFVVGHPSVGHTFYGIMEFAADGRSLFILDMTQGLLRMDLAAGTTEVLRPAPEAAGYFDAYWMYEWGMDHENNMPLTCSADGRWLATVGCWEQQSGVHLCHLPSREWSFLTGEPSQGCPAALAFTTDGLLAAAWRDGSVNLWDPSRRERLGEVLRWGYEKSANGPRAFSRSGDQVADAEVDGAVTVWPWRRLLQ